MHLYFLICVWSSLGCNDAWTKINQDSLEPWPGRATFTEQHHCISGIPGCSFFIGRCHLREYSLRDSSPLNLRSKSVQNPRDQSPKSTEDVCFRLIEIRKSRPWIRMVEYTLNNSLWMGFEWGFPWHKQGIFQQISLDCQSVYGISMTINVYIYMGNHGDTMGI
jgi:hypothetical protein